MTGAALAIGASAAPTLARAQASPSAVREAIARYRDAHEGDVLREFAALLTIPNVATDTSGIRRNAAALLQALERRGVTASLLESPDGGPPVVFGELRVPGATRTVTLYAHYDGQPADPRGWATPPWTPVLRDGPLEQGGRAIPIPATGPIRTGREWRLYARSAGDDKAPIVAMLAALDALRAAGIHPGVNLKFFFEGEEEQGSPHTRAVLERHAARLRSDGWVFADGPAHPSRRQQVIFGVRGVMGVTMTAYGAAHALHSGHYGNWAPNPAAQIATLIASMRAPDGRITIPGFYDDVRALTAPEKRALRTIPDVDSSLRRDLLIARSEGGGARLAERILLPALNVRALRAGPAGGNAPNAIPAEASATLDFRLVPDERPARIQKLVEAHARRMGFHVVHEVPDSATRRARPNILRMEWEDGYPAQRTALSDPFGRAVLRTVEDALGAPVIRVPSLGGSLPTYMFVEVLHAPVVVVPIANHDDNQHAANENLRLQNLWDGVLVFASIEARLGNAMSGSR